MIKITEYYGEKYCNCPICRNEEAEVLRITSNKDITADENNTEYVIYRCESCGEVIYPMDQEIENKVLYSDNMSKIPFHFLAGYLYEHNRDGFFIYNLDSLSNIIKQASFPQKPSDCLDKICCNLYNAGNNYLRGIKTENVPLAIGYASYKLELERMFNELIRNGYVEIVQEKILGDDPKIIDYYCLTLKGLEKAESLLNTNINSKRVFIAMPFLDISDYDYKHLKIRNSAIKKAATDCGFDAHTVDETQHNDDIPDRIIAEIKRSRFVIAEFTGNNHGVYYEAGYAKGLGIPVIKTCKKEWFNKKDENDRKVNTLHFDIEHDNLILWDSIDDLKKKLINRINALF